MFNLILLLSGTPCYIICLIYLSSFKQIFVHSSGLFSLQFLFCSAFYFCHILVWHFPPPPAKKEYCVHVYRHIFRSSFFPNYSEKMLLDSNQQPTGCSLLIFKDLLKNNKKRTEIGRQIRQWVCLPARTHQSWLFSRNVTGKQWQDKFSWVNFLLVLFCPLTHCGINSGKRHDTTTSHYHAEPQENYFLETTILRTSKPAWCILAAVI